MSIDSFMPLSPECWGAEGQIMSSLCIISIECIWEREVSEHPMHYFWQDLSIFLRTLEARDENECAGCVQGMCSCSPKYEGQHFWGFVELLIIRDLQTAEQCFASHSCQCHLGGSEKAEGVTCKSLGSVETWYCCEFFAYSHYLQEFNCMDSMALKCWIVMVHHPWCRTVVCWSVLVRLVITKL